MCAGGVGIRPVHRQGVHSLKRTIILVAAGVGAPFPVLHLDEPLSIGILFLFLLSAAKKSLAILSLMLSLSSTNYTHSKQQGTQSWQQHCAHEKACSRLFTGPANHNAAVELLVC